MTQPDPKSKKPKTVFMTCRNPAKKCASIEAVEVPYAGGARMYRCTKCNFSHVVLVGGKMDLRRL